MNYGKFPDTKEDIPAEAVDFVSEQLNRGADPLAKIAIFDEGVNNLNSVTKFEEGVNKVTPMSRFNQITNLLTNPVP